MVETPDFEQIARRMFPVDNMGHDAIAAELSAESRAHLVEQFRLVWNARGVADAETLESKIGTLVRAGHPAVTWPFRNALRDAISALDRS